MEETRICLKCGEVRPLRSFGLYRDTFGQLTENRDSVCKKCHNDKSTARRRAKNLGLPFEETPRQKKYSAAHKKLVRNKSKMIQFRKRFDTNANYPLEFDEAIHRWEYVTGDSVFIVKRHDHQLIHMMLEFDEESQMFKVDGELLDTLDKHRAAIEMITTDFEIVFVP